MFRIPEYKKLFPTFFRYPKRLFLFLTIAFAIVVLYPQHNFQAYIAQGDHGRDLYCFKKTLDGALPYRDYSWLFGPLMPYYYSLFYKLLGVSIQSVLWGQLLLVLAITLLIFLTSAIAASPAIAFLCAVWYLTFRNSEFFYTYNHTGGLVAMLAAIYCVFRYIREPKKVFALIGAISLFLLTLIRPNIGISSLTAFLGSLLFTDFTQRNPSRKKNRITFILLTSSVILAALAVYGLLTFGLPEYVLRQSFPFSASQRADLTTSPLGAVGMLLQLIVSLATENIYNRLLSGIFLLLLLNFTLTRAYLKFSAEYKKEILLFLGCLGLFIFCNVHEFIASGVFYRLYWIMPLAMLVFFYLTDILIRAVSRSIKPLLYLSVGVACYLGLSNQAALVSAVKKQNNAFVVGNNKVYTLQDPRWFYTVRETTAYINTHLGPQEKFFAVPFDPLYYFLTDRDSPTTQLVFFEHFQMPAEQERSVIADLEKNRVNYVVLSSRAFSQEGGLGTFGKTYCPLLAKYIEDKFQLQVTFGDWQHPPGWAWNHGTKIFKRTQLLK